MQSKIKITLVDLFTDIIKRCRNGDRDAQEAVYNLLAGKMFAVCLRYCSNYEEARDLLHDGFVTIFTKIGQFNNVGSFEGWVRKIFINLATEWYRNCSKMKMVECSDDFDRYFFVDPEEDDEESGVYSLTEEDLLAMVDELPNQYKIVFNLYVIDGMSHKEIAKKLKISEGTSRSNFMRARTFMQKRVSDKVGYDLMNNASRW